MTVQTPAAPEQSGAALRFASSILWQPHGRFAPCEAAIVAFINIEGCRAGTKQFPSQERTHKKDASRPAPCEAAGTELLRFFFLIQRLRSMAPGQREANRTFLKNCFAVFQIVPGYGILLRRIRGEITHEKAVCFLGNIPADVHKPFMFMRPERSP